MQLLDHVSISVTDINAARAFYDAVMRALDAVKVYDRVDAVGYGERCSADDTQSTCIAIYPDPAPVGGGRRHRCFKAPTRAHVDAFFAAGLASGGRSMGEPGLRSQYHRDYYAAFLVDPDGNHVEAVCHAAG